MLFPETRAAWRKYRENMAQLSDDDRSTMRGAYLLQAVGGMIMGAAVTYMFGWPAFAFMVGLALWKVGHDAWR